MKRSTPPAAKPKRRYAGWPPETPGVIAPRFLALFAEVERPRRRAFLAAFVQAGGHITTAIKTAGGGWENKVWLRGDPVYRTAFERAQRLVAEAAERAVCRRAPRAALSNARLMSLLRFARRESYGRRFRATK